MVQSCCSKEETIGSLMDVAAKMTAEQDAAKAHALAMACRLAEQAAALEDATAAAEELQRTLQAERAAAAATLASLAGTRELLHGAEASFQALRSTLDVAEDENVRLKAELLALEDERSRAVSTIAVSQVVTTSSSSVTHAAAYTAERRSSAAVVASDGGSSASAATVRDERSTSMASHVTVEECVTERVTAMHGGASVAAPSALQALLADEQAGHAETRREKDALIQQLLAQLEEAAAANDRAPLAALEQTLREKDEIISLLTERLNQLAFDQCRSSDDGRPRTPGSTLSRPATPSDADGTESLDVSRSGEEASVAHGSTAVSCVTRRLSREIPKRSFLLMYQGPPALAACRSLQFTECMTFQRLPHNTCCGWTQLVSVDFAGVLVASIGNNFLAGCAGLTTLRLPGVERGGSIGQRFLAGCLGLRALDLTPVSEAASIDSGFLFCCAALTVVDLRAFTRLQRMAGGALGACPAVARIAVPVAQYDVIRSALDAATRSKARLEKM
jgi:hypothetical protein